MYVVLTIGELFLHSAYFGGHDGKEDTGIEEVLGWDFRNLEAGQSGLPSSELDKFEIALTEEQARRLGILAPRGEYWISRVFGNKVDLETLPRAIAPDRPLPSKGRTSLPNQIVPTRGKSPGPAKDPA